MEKEPFSFLMSILKCILHIDPNLPKEPVKEFNSVTWNKVKAVASRRLDCPVGTRSKYLTICTQLPDTISESDGYHSIPVTAASLQYQELLQRNLLHKKQVMVSPLEVKHNNTQLHHQVFYHKSAYFATKHAKRKRAKN